MSSPSGPVLEGVQHLANYLARQLSRGVVDDLTSETGQRLAGGLSPGEVGLARQFAGRAEDLRVALAGSEPGTRLADLPEYAALGTSPKIDVVRVRGDSELADELRTQLAALPSGTTLEALAAYRDRPDSTGLEFRTDPFAGGPYFSAEFAAEQVEVDEAGGSWTGDGVEYIGILIGAIVPFDLYSG